MKRRRFLAGSVGAVGMTTLAGCSAGGDVILRKSGITSTSAKTEWERELQEGDRLELAVELEDGMQVDGYVHRTDDDEQIAWVSGTSEGRTAREEFEVPTTTDYVISLEANGGQGTVILREA